VSYVRDLTFLTGSPNTLNCIPHDHQQTRPFFCPKLSHGLHHSLMNLASVRSPKTHNQHAMMWLVAVLRKSLVSGNQQAPFPLNPFPKSIIWHALI